MTNKPTTAGFTLIETLVAVLLLATAIAGPLTIASKSLLAAKVAQSQITAFFLAQDAVEFVRFARDTNKLRGVDWLTGGGTGISLTNCISADGCYLDATMLNPATPEACSTCNTPLTSGSNYLYETNGYYSYDSGGTRTPFVRQITITTIETTEVLVEVTVRWRDAVKEHQVVVRETMFDWQ